MVRTAKSLNASLDELARREAAFARVIDEKGRPGVVERVYILPPASRIGPIKARRQT